MCENSYTEKPKKLADRNRSISKLIEKIIHHKIKKRAKNKTYCRNTIFLNNSKNNNFIIYKQ